MSFQSTIHNVLVSTLTGEDVNLVSHPAGDEAQTLGGLLGENGHKSTMMILQSSSQVSGREEAPARVLSRRPLRDKLRTACRGIKLGVRGHSSFSVHFFFTALVLAAAIVLHCDLVQWCLLLGCIGLVLTTELFSSALEALFRGLDQESRERAWPCLAIAAGAVLLASITASIIGGLILLSRLIETCAPLFQGRQ